MGKQTFINEMTCNFNLREPKAKKPTNIYFIVCIEGKQIKFSTGVKVYPEQWNKKKQEAYVSNQLSELDNRNNTIVNKKITAMKKDYMDYKNYLCDYPDQLTLKKPLLKQFIYKEKMTKIATTSAIATMKRIIVEKRVSDNSKQQYTRNINKFERFLKEHHIKDEFQHINLKTIKCYQQYLIETGDTPKTIKNIIKGTIFPILKQVDKDENIPFDWNASKLDSFELAKDYSISTHSLRKTFGRKVFKSSDNAELALVKLMELFNHSNVTITKRYLGLKQEEILQTYDCLNF